MKIVLELEAADVVSTFATDSLRLHVRDKEGVERIFILSSLPRGEGQRLADEFGIGGALKQLYSHPR